MSKTQLSSKYLVRSQGTIKYCVVSVTGAPLQYSGEEEIALRHDALLTCRGCVHRVSEVLVRGATP